jgi:hypothetical protein
MALRRLMLAESFSPILCRLVQSCAEIMQNLRQCLTQVGQGKPKDRQAEGVVLS